jgi:hypothetical protein
VCNGSVRGIYTVNRAYPLAEPALCAYRIDNTASMQNFGRNIYELFPLFLKWYEILMQI